MSRWLVKVLDVKHPNRVFNGPSAQIMYFLILRSDSEVDTQKIENMPLRMKLAKAISDRYMYHFYVLVISPVAPGILRPIHLLFAVLISVLSFNGSRLQKIWKAV